MSLDDKTSSDGRIPPSTPPKNRGGLSGWQKAVIGASVPIVILAGYFGINALRNQQYKPTSTPTPVPTAIQAGIVKLRKS